jgi:hypothetical protein
MAPETKFKVGDLVQLDYPRSPVRDALARRAGAPLAARIGLITAVRVYFHGRSHPSSSGMWVKVLWNDGSHIKHHTNYLKLL